MKFYDVQQNTEEWEILRSGIITSSQLPKIMANYGKAFGEPAKKLAVDIAISRITGNKTSGSYSNEHMERGHEEEPLARMQYESDYFCSVLNGGFYSDGETGCSPDGLVGSDGLIEIKSAIPSVHYHRIKMQSFDPAYKWQIVGNLKFTERDWLDFISYCSEFPSGKKLYVYRCFADDFQDEFQMLDNRISEFKGLISESILTINDSKYSLIQKKNKVHEAA